MSCQMPVIEFNFSSLNLTGESIKNIIATVLDKILWFKHSVSVSCLINMTEIPDSFQ